MCCRDPKTGSSRHIQEMVTVDIASLLIPAYTCVWLHGSYCQKFNTHLSALVPIFFIPYSPPSLFITRNLRFFLISIGSLIRCCQSMWCWIRLMPCFDRPTRRCHQCMVVSHSTSSGNSSTTSYPTSATTQPLTGINYSHVITGY